jgi:hypothetical protein
VGGLEGLVDGGGELMPTDARSTDPVFAAKVARIACRSGSGTPT